MMHASNSPAGLLHSETDCRDRGFSHNALAGVTRQLCQGQSPFVVRSWSIAYPDRRCQIHPHLPPAETTGSYGNDETSSFHFWKKCIYFKNLQWRQISTLFNLYKSKIFRSTWGILNPHPCKSQNLAIWSKKLSLTLVWAFNKIKIKQSAKNMFNPGNSTESMTLRHSNQTTVRERNMYTR